MSVELIVQMYMSCIHSMKLKQHQLADTCACGHAGKICSKAYQLLICKTCRLQSWKLSTMSQVTAIAETRHLLSWGKAEGLSEGPK